MSDQPISTAVDRTERLGSPGLVLLFAMVLAGAAATFSLLPKDEAGNLVIGLLAVLAIVGIFASFAVAAGILQFFGQSSKNDLTKLICDGNPEGLIAIDGSGKIIYANETYMNLSGAHDPADLRTVERLFSGAPDVSEAIYRLAQAARDGKRRAEELRLSPPLGGEGRVGWYKIKVRPLTFASSRRATLWTVAEVTRERERQENVFQELQHAIDFLDYAPAGFFSCDQRGSVSYMNATLAAWLDYDLAQVGSGGLALTDFVAGDGASLLASIAGGSGEVRTEQFDIDLKRRSGQSLPARLLHRVAFGQDGAPGASRTLVLNRAQGEEPAEDLRAAEVRFARVFNSTPMAIAILDAAGRITRSNAAFARLMPDALKPADGAAGRSIYSGILERDRGSLETALAAASQSKSDIPPVDVGLHGEGERSARLFISASEEREGTGATIYALDTTEQRTLQNNFAQSQKMQAIGQLAGGVAHDFNNVLTAIIGYSDLLLANHRPTDPSFRDIMQIKQNANRAAGLVRQLLAFSRRQTLRPQILQLGDVLSDLQMLMRRLVGEKIDLDLRHGRDLWLVKADLNQFEQVIVNLIVNARDAMPDGGKILLRTRNVDAAECAGFDEKSLAPADYVAIEVEDFGCGIPPDVKDKIFEPFFTTKEVGKGTGLGLSMVYGIVKQTGGYVFCASVLGKGTVFTILLPRYVAEAADAPQASEPAKAPAADLTGHGTILLVEDEEAVRAFGARALASRGYTVLQAATGLEALEIAEENQGLIDLVVSDVVMPEMDGPTMFGELRKRGVKAKVIFVSGYAEEAFAKNLPEGEDFGFLPKPFSLKQLIEAVKGTTTPAS
ncbi:response regulator [Methylocapsa polymorpha]|uniref:histidine kinase n=1 Tax=Methylocapsa polymorpha TaxID=3080828 RepID=A0ABZ0HR85_9HYPH|nr:response regulator [Methylocapsa sp. RX1]